MNIVTRKTLVEFYTRHPKAKAPLSAWYKHVKAANWASPQDVKEDFNSADFVADNRVIFNIGGNNYRLVVRISYTFKQVLVKFVGTHDEYDHIDAVTV
jgi:mRNA interferase HigB